MPNPTPADWRAGVVLDPGPKFPRGNLADAARRKPNQSGLGARRARSDPPEPEPTQSDRATKHQRQRAGLGNREWRKDDVIQDEFAEKKARGRKGRDPELLGLASKSSDVAAVEPTLR